MCNQPEADTYKKQHVMSGVARAVDSDGPRLTCAAGIWMANSIHFAAQSLVEGEQQGMMATSYDRGRDVRLCSVRRALNNAPGTESQSAQEVSVSIPVTKNRSRGEQDDHYNSVQRPCVLHKAVRF
uniref:Uncharacterized protein n=1 Tax=Mesocestoides corti TaxID=53468 RepID=A0A5K3FP12_MESCO